jgi:SAM-dependent methyltransferase
MTYLQYWRDFDRFSALMAQHPFKFAKTMPAHPHHYTLRKTWAVQADFDWAVQFIRAHGYPQRWASTTYVYMDVNEHCYWTMGAPVRETILINRANKDRTMPYDVLAPLYDAMFIDTESKAENAQVLATIGDLTRKRVLDVGCGTGFLLRETPTPLGAFRYVGIDPSRSMIERLRGDFPHAEVVNTPLGSYGTDGYFDVLLALFGVGSYLSDRELARIPSLLAPNGLAAVMFYRPGYKPRTHEQAALEVPFRPLPDLLPWPVQHLETVGDGHALVIHRHFLNGP